MDVLQQVADFINLLEKDYFGLTYRDVQGTVSWLNLDKKVGCQSFIRLGL